MITNNFRITSSHLNFDFLHPITAFEEIVLQRDVGVPPANHICRLEAGGHLCRQDVGAHLKCARFLHGEMIAGIFAGKLLSDVGFGVAVGWECHGFSIDIQQDIVTHVVLNEIQSLGIFDRIRD